MKKALSFGHLMCNVFPEGPLLRIGGEAAVPEEEDEQRIGGV